MKKPGACTLLNQLILEKEAAHTAEGRSLKEDLRRTAESLKPINIIKNTFKELVSPPVGASLLDAAIGVSTGFIAKKTFVGSSQNLFKKLAGLAVELIVANKATKNAGRIKKIAGMLFSNLTGGCGSPEKKDG